MRRENLFYSVFLFLILIATSSNNYSFYNPKGPKLDELRNPDKSKERACTPQITKEELEKLDRRYSYQISLCEGAKKHYQHQEFVEVLSESLGGEVSINFLNSILDDRRICYNPNVLKPRMTWGELREKVNSEESLALSRDFYIKYRETFDSSYTNYKIDPKLILSIIKIETNFGENLNEAPPVIFTLYNLYFMRKDKQKIIERSRIFFTTMVLDLGWDPFVGGSREAAVGLPQFMLLKESLYYSADGDCDGRIDLNNIPDAIESVAKYISLHNYGKRSIEEVLYSYNHSRTYGKIVLEHRSLLKLELEN